MKMQTGRGLSMVAKREFEAKVASLANPSRGAETYAIVGGKVRGVKIDVLMDAVIKAGNTFQQTQDKFFIARR